VLEHLFFLSFFPFLVACGFSCAIVIFSFSLFGSTLSGVGVLLYVPVFSSGMIVGACSLYSVVSVFSGTLIGGALMSLSSSGSISTLIGGVFSGVVITFCLVAGVC